MKWAGRTFSFAPLWTNLNVLTATTIVLTGVSAPDAPRGYAARVYRPRWDVAFRPEGGGRGRRDPTGTAGPGAAAVLLYPVVLIAAVALVNLAFPKLPLTAAIAVTVAIVLFFIAVLAAALAPQGVVPRTARTGDARFAHGLALRVRPLRSRRHPRPLSESPRCSSAARRIPLCLAHGPRRAPALALIMGVGFVVGVHVIPMVLLLNTAFPLDGGPAWALWAAALLGAQSTPFSPRSPAPSPCSRG